MLNEFVDYRWRDHVPSPGPADLAIVAVTGLALLLPAVCDWPTPAGAQGGTHAAVHGTPGTSPCTGSAV
ncbi:hypothetical protein [Azospirillum sp. ST 5-10]|uniref:hypothetical protein n=1 Tax=unclassified Azospirillum TaxID=2630922 RepID=UPI003F49EF13